MENLPNTYLGKNEENLRDHIILLLSAIPNLNVSGETFNHGGKTDILVSRNGNTQFIGECKFWHGESEFHKAISQLMRYLSWTNDKAAIILFVQNSNIIDTIEKAKNAMDNNSEYKFSFLEEYDSNWFNYEYNDGNRRLELTLMLYHFPIPKASVG